MAVDVLTYNALQQVNEELRKEIASLTDDITTAQASGGGGGATKTDAQCIVEMSNMLQANQWCQIPTGHGEDGTGTFGNGFKVCDDTGYYRCGRSCTWTVPSGTTQARFQIWGSGGGSNESRCCGFSPIGSSGAYASAILPVTAGQSYTLCAGCAYCCYAQSDGTHMIQTCPSYVQGTGLTNFCAQGGFSCIYLQIKHRNDQFFPSFCGYCCCNWMNGCICKSGAWVCSEFSTPYHGYPEGYCDGSYMPWLNEDVKYYGDATGENASVWGIRGQWSYLSADYAMPMQYWSATSYGFPGSCCGRGGCWVCDNCGGWCQNAWQQGVRQIPGVGGWGNSRCGGGCNCGDAGRFGMVCVSYN
tara:strand:- start:2080 stop:3153 length:1074 start_codon:yes stop_codon:yes gene_type:complete